MRVGRERRSSRKRRERKRQQRRVAIVVAILLGIPLLLAAVAATFVSVSLRAVASIQQDIPSLEDQGEVSLAQTTQIYAADGSLLAYLHGVENRTIISGKDIPDMLRNALVAIEDERFYEHDGVDLRSFFRALAENLRAQKLTQGFSTITMQLVGNLYLDRTEISLRRKFNEVALAYQLERKYSKKEIIDLYLNTVYFGSNAYGVEAAARTYFDKDPKDLTLAEAALLAGLPQAPSAYSPRKHPDRALERRNLVLRKMFENGYITEREYQQAVAEPLELAPYSPYTRVQEPYVVAYVRKQLIDMFGVEKVFSGGLRVETTIDPELQQLAMEAIKSTLDQEGDPSAALVSIEVGTGYIRAMVGGRDYDSSKFNLAVQGRRQPGSAFKTFCLTAAIEKGINPYETYYESMPLSLKLPGSDKPWTVKTFGNTYTGATTIARATLRSDNSVYAQLALDVTPEHIVDVAHRMGITSYLNPTPAIVLGGLTYGVSPLEMAAAYATLANMGEYVAPTIILRIRDSQGKVIWEAHPKRSRAIAAGVAYEVTKLLADNIKSGTGTKANIDRPAAGKTGTAQEYYDAWFCGYTPHLSTTVWVGHPEAQIPMTNVHGIRVTGGSFPAEIWRKFMYEADRRYPKTDFPEPEVKVAWNYFFVSKWAVFPTSTTTSSTTTTSTTTSTTTTTLPPSTTTTKKPPGSTSTSTVTTSPSSTDTTTL